jgi:hypothetical protein
MIDSVSGLVIKNLKVHNIGTVSWQEAALSADVMVDCVSKPPPAPAAGERNGAKRSQRFGSF